MKNIRILILSILALQASTSHSITTISTKPTKQEPISKEMPAVTSAKIERTLAIIKPDAIPNMGRIIDIIQLNKFSIFRLKMVSLNKKQAEAFYKVHKDKPFFKDLVDYMTSGPVVVLALQKENAIKEWRDLMGATNPKNAAPGTLRRMFGTSITYNATHGSDSVTNAEIELNFFFPELQYS